jgi:hypothetical protein
MTAQHHRTRRVVKSAPAASGAAQGRTNWNSSGSDALEARSSHA